MLRLFVALEIPEDVRDALPMADETIQGAAWVADENLHLTLRFIGEVDNAKARDIDDVLSALRCPRFALTLAGVDTFGGRRPHALYVGARTNQDLLHLQQKVETAVNRLGLIGEGRRFTPHVTLARLKNAPEHKLAAFIQAHSLFDSGPFPVDRFCLYSSVLHPDGSVYAIERTYELR
jgi:2'-5' RNA ligase